MLSIEEAFDRTLSLPSTPLVREAPTNFSSLVIEGDREGLKSRSGSEKSKGREERRERLPASPTTSGSMALSKRTFLEGLKRRTRTRSGDNLFGEERPAADEELQPARRASEASQKLVSPFFGAANEKLILDNPHKSFLFCTLSKLRSEMPTYS